jgi:microcystin-dependent protein
MARDLYQGTVALTNSQGTLTPIKDARVTVYLAGTTTLATIYQAATGAAQGPRPGSGAASGPNPFLTGLTGAIDFYADAPAAYDIKIDDTQVPARLSSDTFRWNADTGEDNAMPGVKLTDSSITPSKIADNSLPGTKLSVKSIPIGKLADGAVDSAALGVGSIQNQHISDQAILEGKIANGTLSIAKLASAIIEKLVPSGTIMATGRSTAPTGYVLCDGAAISRTTFPDLFNAIGTTYGIGNGSSTFNVPDLRGRVPVGADGVAGRLDTADALGNAGGVQKITLSIGQLPVHSHDSGSYAGTDHLHAAGSLTANANGAHSHNVTIGEYRSLSGPTLGGTWNIGVYPANSVIDVAQWGGSTDTQGNHGHSIGGATAAADRFLDVTGSSGNTGSGQAVDIMQPYQVVNYMIKT